METSNPMSPRAAEAEANRLAGEIEALGGKIATARTNIGRVIFGQQEIVEQTLTTLLSGGHALLVGVPGLGKTRRKNGTG